MLRSGARFLAPTPNERHRQDVGIQRNRPIANVIDVVTESFFKARVTAPAVNLSIARDSRPHCMPRIVAWMFFSEFARKFGTFRTRPDETHLAAQHIPELRQLVKAGSAQVIANARTPRISRNRPDRSESGFGIFLHGPKFDECELPLLETNANLPVQNRTAIRKSNRS